MIKKLFYPLVILTLLLFIFPLGWVSAAPTGNDASNPAQATGTRGKGFAIFSENCAACHTLGSGDATVPDLEGVTSRRAEGWLKSFIQLPSKMFETKDPIAMELLAKYKEPMSDPGLTPEDVDAVVEYLEAMDKEIKHPQDAAKVAVSLPSAAEETSFGQKVVTKRAATEAEVEAGRALFQGTHRFLHGGPACFACHDLRNSTSMGAGRLAKELVTAYSRLGEVRMRAILEKPPFPLMREAYKDKPLTRDEISNLLAFFEYADKEHRDEPQKHYGDAMLFVGISSLIGLFGFYSVFWSSRRRKSVNKDIYDRQTKSRGKK